MLQVENNLRLGWTPIVVTNFDFEWLGVKAIRTPIFNNWSAFASKIPILSWLMKTGQLNDDVFMHDYDCYTLMRHEFPEQKDIGMVRCGTPNRNKLQGGVMYIRKSGFDMIHQMGQEITDKRLRKEELYFPGYFSRTENKDRFTYLNYRYNVFRQGLFKSKWPLTIQPAINVHFHLEDKSCSDCFIEGKNAYSVKVVTPEIVDMARRYKLL